MVSRHFISRHSIKPTKKDVESKQYRGISGGGVQLARDSARNILVDMEKSPAGSVMFLGGVSDAVRTRSTAQVYGDELKALVKDRDDYLVVCEGDYSGIGELKKIIRDNPDKKIIIDVPMFLKELSMMKRWTDGKGNYTEFTKRLLRKGNGSEYKSLKYWINHPGRIGKLEGPKPEEVAKTYQQGVGRLEKFAEGIAGKRLYKTGIVGHSMEADVYLAYLAGEGKIDVKTLEKLANGKGMIRETEMANIDIDSGKATISYRGKETSANLERITAAVLFGSAVLSLLFSPSFTGNVIGAGSSKYLGLVFSGLAITAIAALIFFSKKRKVKKSVSFYY